MKIFLFVLLIFTTSLFSCSGDCISCHPKLENSISKPHHQILKSCIKCHTTLPEGMSSCGGDCFECHSQSKLIKSKRVEHQSLQKCKTCHINKEDLFKIPNINNNSDLMKLLKNR